MSDEAFFLGHSYFEPLPVRGADAASFEVLNALFAKDARAVYYRYGKVPKADPATFRACDPGFLREEEEATIHPSGNLRFQDYARDHQNVFHYVLTIGQPSIVRGADPGTFETLRWGFARDKDHVYHERTRMKGVKPDAFRQWNNYFSSSNRAVYYLDRLLEGADLATFRVLARMMARDARSVYFHDRAIEGADPETYEPGETASIGKDRSRVFVRGLPLDGADVDTFGSIGPLYQRDRDRVYFLGKPIPKADPRSFRVVETNLAEDARRRYRSGVDIGPSRGAS